MSLSAVDIHVTYTKCLPLDRSFFFFFIFGDQNFIMATILQLKVAKRPKVRLEHWFITRWRRNICEENRWRFRYSLGIERWQCTCRSVSRVVKRWFQHWFDSWLHRLQIFSKPVATNNFGLGFAAKEKSYRHFLVTTFSVASWRLPKEVNFGPCF